MWSDFFRDGGYGMYPTLIFGFFSLAAALLFLLRLDRRYLPVIVSCAVTTLGSGLLGCSVGIANTLRFLEKVPGEDQLKIAALGCQESLNNVVLALMLVVVVGLLTAIGTFRGVGAKHATVS
jgi:hypothetical protein